MSSIHAPSRVDFLSEVFGPKLTVELVRNCLGSNHKDVLLVVFVGDGFASAAPELLFTIGGSQLWTCLIENVDCGLQ